MDYIKQYWKHDGKYHALIRTNCYCHTVNHVLDMVEIALEDYELGNIKTRDISIVTYGGDRIKHIMGIEFPIDKPVDGYKEIHQPECTL